MKTGKTFWWCAAGLASAVAIGACSSSGVGGAGTEGTSDQGAGGHTTSSTTSTVGTGGSGGSSSSSSSSSSSGASLINGCDPATAEDHTTEPNVTITFGGLAYSPACIRIAAGSSVTFSGAFSSHPLAAGEDGVKDATSPIAETATGTTATFMFPNAGAFPYFCTFHQASGMEGAVFAE